MDHSEQVKLEKLPQQQSSNPSNGHDPVAADKARAIKMLMRIVESTRCDVDVVVIGSRKYYGK